MDFEDEQYLKQRLDEIQKDVSKKLKFEPAVAALTALLRDRYSTASPPLRKSFYAVICRVSTVLKTRYTSPGFWAAGLALFRLAVTLVSDAAEKNQLLGYVSDAEKVVRQDDEVPSLSSPPNQGFLFEGHLTVDREPPQPQWLAQSNLLASAAALFAAESSGSGRPEPGTANNGDGESESAVNLLQSLIENLDGVLPPGILDDVRGAPRVPPASKKVVANLPVITITAETLKKLGEEEAECCICKENLVVDDKMQELPCKHTFHPPCLKPWLDEHNSCPICRHELETDDHAYESWKEREREAEEDRKGAANAVRGGEYMYV